MKTNLYNLYPQLFDLIDDESISRISFSNYNICRIKNMDEDKKIEFSFKDKETYCTFIKELANMYNRPLPELCLIHTFFDYEYSPEYMLKFIITPGLLTGMSNYTLNIHKYKRNKSV